MARKKKGNFFTQLKEVYLGWLFYFTSGLYEDAGSKWGYNVLWGDFFAMVQRPLVVQGILILEASGRGLCDEPITSPEESYWLWCVVVCDVETSWMRRPLPSLGRSATGKTVTGSLKQVHEFFLER